MSLKPLVMWARDQYPEPYKLRYTQRTPTEARGFVLIDGQWTRFIYDREARVITLGEGDSAQVIRINQWGWEQDKGPIFLFRE
ncbi:MAG TPA: hypothetical protein EYP25_02635 [Anaerolineae bacterium]|nr:hypothetical protein [Anaerolineae bacterium]